jgi:transposase
MMTAEPAGVTGGVDTHADIHVAAVMCSTSHRLLGVAEFETTPVGYVATYDWMASFGPVDAVGIEGTGSYGAGLARFLTEQGVELVEVTRPDRQARRAQGKSDPVDAEAAARAVLSGRATARPKTRDGLVEAIRLHLLVYDAMVGERTAMSNRLHAVLTSAPAEIRLEVAQIRESARIVTLSRWRARAGDDVVAAAAGTCCASWHVICSALTSRPTQPGCGSTS